MLSDLSNCIISTVLCKLVKSSSYVRVLDSGAMQYHCSLGYTELVIGTEGVYRVENSYLRISSLIST